MVCKNARGQIDQIRASNSRFSLEGLAWTLSLKFPSPADALVLVREEVTDLMLPADES